MLIAEGKIPGTLTIQRKEDEHDPETEESTRVSYPAWSHLQRIQCICAGKGSLAGTAVDAWPRRPHRGAAPPPQGQQQDGRQDTAARYPDEVRSIDGTANNLGNPLWGSAGVEFLRLTTVGYADGASEPSGDKRPNAREISNACAAYDGDAPNTVNASDFLWQWGQFIDHDVAETPVADPAERFDIEVPAGDPDFDPLNTGEVTIPLDRSHYNIVNGVRQQVNQITAFIDASNVYGSDEERALELRTLDGTGRLKTSDGDLLPFNENGLADAFFNPDEIINHGIEPYLRGLAAQACQNVDSYVVDDVRNFLFGVPGAGGFDLASLNIQRGRDHGLPGYNQVRRDHKLSPAQSFANMSSDPEVQANLAAVYGSPDEVDLWVGGLAEDHLAGALVGETFARILGDQFERL